MIGARLLVEKGSYRNHSQDWGTFAFLALPSPGDRIAVSHDGVTQYLTVLCAHHRPVAMAPATEAGSSGAAPAADVVAKWTGSEGDPT